MLCEFYIFYLAFILFVTSSESPSDDDFLGSVLFVWYESPPEPQLLELLQRPGKDEGLWWDDAKGMVNDNKCVQSLGGRGMSRSIRNGICVCVVVVIVIVVVFLLVVVLIAAMEVMGVVVLMLVVGTVVRVACVGVMGVVGILCIGVLEVDCVKVVEILVLGAVFVVEVVEGVELVVGCVVGRVVRLVLWCVNGRRYFLRCFSLKSVEMKGLSVGSFLFGMVIWADVLLGVMVVVEVVVVETADTWFFIFFRRGCLGDMMDVRVVMELVIGVVVLVGVVEVFYSVTMGVGVGGVGNGGRSVESGGGDASVADGGADDGGARWRDCCRFFDGIFRELQEDLPYHLPFRLNVIDFFL